MRERITLAGFLRGQGTSANCTLRATKVSLAGSDEFDYANIEVIDVDKQLPSGVFELTYAGRVANMREVNGHWIAA
jgi:hypothetical protein